MTSSAAKVDRVRGHRVPSSVTVRTGLGWAGYSNVEPIHQGSAVRDNSFRTWQAIDIGRVSDFDIALANSTLLSRGEELGIDMHSGGTRTGRLTAWDLELLGLQELSNLLTKQAGGEVNFIIYDNPATAIQRVPIMNLPISGK